MYFLNPIPLPINSSPYYLLPKQLFKSTLDHLKFAVKVLQFAHSFKIKIDKRQMPQEYGSGHASGTALCMNTYNHFFGCCRIPGADKDEFMTPAVLEVMNNTAKDQLNRIVVASRNQFFLLKLSHENFSDESLLMDCLKCISFLSKENEVLNYPAVGLLTTENRRTWGCIRAHMVQSKYVFLILTAKCLTLLVFASNRHHEQEVDRSNRMLPVHLVSGWPRDPSTKHRVNKKKRFQERVNRKRQQTWPHAALFQPPDRRWVRVVHI